jgi:hypothetical protein
LLKEKFQNQTYAINFNDEDYEYYNTVRKSYLIDILEKTEKLEHQLFALSEKKDLSENKDIIYECNRIAHSIKGTGYSFGFKFISEISFCIEELLDYVLNNIDIDINTIQSIFCISNSFNDLLSDVIKTQFLNTTNFDANKLYYDKLYKMIDKTDLIFKKSTSNKPKETEKNVLICGNNNFIFNNIKRYCKNNQNYKFHFAPSYLGAIYEISNKRIDFIFSEFELQKFNAISLYISLKYVDAYKNIPFYFIVSDINQKMKDANISKDIVLFKKNYLLKNIIDILKC